MDDMPDPTAILATRFGFGLPDATVQSGGVAGMLGALSGEDAEVTAISPPARMRAAATTGLHTDVATPQERKSERARGGHKVKPERVKRATAGEPSPFMMFGF